MHKQSEQALLLVSLIFIATAGFPAPNADSTIVYAPVVVASNDPVTLVAAGGGWKYLDTGVDQGTLWREGGFDDVTWLSGPAPLGYGNLMSTTVNGGPANNHFPTIYFRKMLNVSNPSDFSGLALNLRRDDGAVVYLNGVEIARSNMPAGTILYATLASSTVGGVDETTFFSQPVQPGALVSGTNVLAVEVHQRALNSTDLAFDLSLIGMSGATPTPTATAVPTDGLRFAVIGDFGNNSSAEQQVATMVIGWNPAFIVTTGDNNYQHGEATTIDTNIGKYYSQFIGNYHGAWGPGSAINRFWPSLGNHDWETITCNTQGCSGPYLDYFTLPGNERYFEVDLGLVNLFIVDSDGKEPDGRTSTSIQANWLRNALSASTSCFDVVTFHHPPYSSGFHGSDTNMRWPFQAWGADVVLTGHDHNYERIDAGGFPYFVNGAGGASLRALPNIGTLPQGIVSAFINNQNHGAMLVTATKTGITYQFFAANGTKLDELSVAKNCPGNLPPTLTPTATSTTTSTTTATSTPTLTITPTAPMTSTMKATLTSTATPSATPTLTTTLTPAITATLTPTTTATIGHEHYLPAVVRNAPTR